MAAETINFVLKNDAGTVLHTFPVSKCKLDATAAPGTGDDDADGYVAGSMWVDRTADKVYFCTDNATGAATWIEVGAAGGGYTDEQAQDAVGGILVDSSTVDFTYNDATPSITAIVIDDSITDAKLRNSSALSVVGRSANSTGDPADIAAASDGEVLRRSGTTLGFGTVATAGITDDAVTYAKIQNVTDNRLLGRSAGSSGDTQEITVGIGLSLSGGELTASGSYTDEQAQDAVGAMIADTATIDLTYTDATPSLTADVKDDSISNAKLRNSVGLSVIGRSAITSGDPGDISAVDGNGPGFLRFRDDVDQVAWFQSAAVGLVKTDGTNFTVNTADAADLSSNSVTTVKIVNAAVTDIKLRQSAARSVIGNSLSSAATPADIAASADGQVLQGSGGGLAFGVITASMLPALNGFTDAEPALDDVLPGYDTSAAANRDFVAARLLALAGASGVCGLRPTTESGVSVSTSDRTAQGTVYLTFHDGGNQVLLYDGTRDAVYKLSAELSCVLTDATKSPAAVAANSNYDLLVWDDAGTVRLSRGPAWSTDTSRGTGAGTAEVAYFNGRLTNAVAVTNGPAANRGTVVGTIRGTGAGTTEDSEAKRFVWSLFNQVPRPLYKAEATNSWTVSSQAWESLNGSTANRAEFIRGLAGAPVKLIACCNLSFASANNGFLGIGLDSTTVNSAKISNGGGGTSIVPANAVYEGTPSLGYHYLQLLQAIQNASPTGTFYGDAGLDPGMRTGCNGVVYG